MMANCFMTTFNRLDTIDRCVSMAPPIRSRYASTMSLMRIRWS